MAIELSYPPLKCKPCLMLPEKMTCLCPYNCRRHCLSQQTVYIYI